MIKILSIFILLSLCACHKAQDSMYTGNPLSLGTPVCGGGDVCSGGK